MNCRKRHNIQGVDNRLRYHQCAADSLKTFSVQYHNLNAFRWKGPALLFFFYKCSFYIYLYLISLNKQEFIDNKCMLFGSCFYSNTCISLIYCRPRPHRHSRAPFSFTGFQSQHLEMGRVLNVFK